MGRLVNVWDESDRFVIFGSKTLLTLYRDLGDDSPKCVTFDVLDSLRESSNESVKQVSGKLKQDAHITSVSVNKLADLDKITNEELKSSVEVPDGSQYVITISLTGGALLLYLYNHSNDSFRPITCHFFNDGGDLASEVRVEDGFVPGEGDAVEVATVLAQSVYTLVKLKEALYLYNWKDLKVSKLFEGVLTFKLNGELLLLFYRDKIQLYSFSLEIGAKDTGPDLTLKQSLALQGVSFPAVDLYSHCVSVLWDGNMAFLSLVEGVFYTFLDKFRLYKFVSNLPSGQSQSDEKLVGASCRLYSRLVNDLKLLVTLNAKGVQIWEHDTQNILFQLDNRSFESCLLNVIDGNSVNLMAFHGHELVENIKLSISDDKLIPVHKDNPQEGKDDRVEGKDKLPEKDDSLGGKEGSGGSEPDNAIGGKRKLEEERYKKLKRIKRYKLVDNEARENNEEEEEEEESYGEEEEEVGSAKNRASLSEGSEQEGEELYGARNDFLSQDERYPMNERLENELAKLQRRLKALEKKVLRRTPKVIMPGACPMPNDKLKQWCLFWNEYGHVSKQNSLENNNLHIYLFSGPLSGYIKKPDRYNCHVASLCVDGIICGSNINNNNTLVGVIYYLNLATNESWERRFKDESVVCVAVSDKFVAAATDVNVLYIFTRNNLLLSVFKLKGRVRSLVANRNVLAILTELPGGEGVTLSVRLLWINGIRGLSKNNAMKIISIYDDLLTLEGDVDLKFVGLTCDFILWYIDTKGYLWLLVNSMSNLSGLGMMEWLPTINVLGIGRGIFPLYVDNLQLCYVKLRPNEQSPDCSKNTNFFGYTLSRLNLRVENLCGYYFNYGQYQSILRANPGLKEYVQGAPEGADESTLSIPWQQYDDMRFLQDVNVHHLEYIVKLVRLNSFWFAGANSLDGYLSSISLSERNHDKWLLRILRKIQLSKELYINSDVIQMLKMPRCLEIARTIIKDDKYKKLINDSLMLLKRTSQLMAN